jgi:hypothetical protein
MLTSKVTVHPSAQVDTLDFVLRARKFNKQAKRVIKAGFGGRNALPETERQEVLNALDSLQASIDALRKARIPFGTRQVRLKRQIGAD